MSEYQYEAAMAAQARADAWNPNGNAGSNDPVYLRYYEQEKAAYGNINKPADDYKPTSQQYETAMAEQARADAWNPLGNAGSTDPIYMRHYLEQKSAADRYYEYNNPPPKE